MLKPTHLALLRVTVDRVSPVEDDAWAGLVPLVRHVRMAKGDVFLRAGEHAHAFGWVLAGIMRKFYVSAGGREHNAGFSVEGRPFGSFADIISGAPSRVSIDCLEDVEAAVVEWSEFQALCVRDPRWQATTRAIAEVLLVAKTRREQELLTLDAEDRYRLLLAREPEVALRVPLYHLASHLGMRPEHLSRIRRKLSEPSSKHK